MGVDGGALLDHSDLDSATTASVWVYGFTTTGAIVASQRGPRLSRPLRIREQPPLPRHRPPPPLRHWPPLHRSIGRQMPHMRPPALA
eukprot:scaffold15879_cov66-Phaeocystis_antarctica.AAC.1